MRLIDLYFRAFEDYKKTFINNSENIKNRRLIKRAKNEEDYLEITKYNCDVDESWIVNIEEGLVYIQKAIDQARQFIRSEGEVFPIEKVKKTSVESVKHLSRNSNFITRIPKEGEKLIPDKLYVVKKLSDYAVYENRFLYLLLTYLKDFISTRLEKIKTKVTTYESEMLINKEIKLVERQIDYKLEFSDLYANDPFLLEAYKDDLMMRRIETMYSTVDSLLKIPLMKEVSKTALLKPPIVKTNALRMNPNFRAALGLYDYIMSYNKLGYEIIENKQKYNPFIDSMNEEIIETIELTTFISYKFGNEINDNLQLAFDEEEKRIQTQNAEHIKEELNRLKKRVKEKKIDLEEYILLLEKRNKQLEIENSDLNELKKLNKKYLVENKIIEEEVKVLNEQAEESSILVTKQTEEIERLNKKYFEDMIKAEKVHQEEMQALIEKHEYLINDLTEKQKESILLLQNEFEEEKLVIISEHKAREENLLNTLQIRETTINEMTNNKNQLIIEHDQILVSINLKHEDELNTLNNEIVKLEDEKNSIKGLHYALKKEYDLVGNEDQFTSKDAFKELKKIKSSFNKFFQNQWDLTKASIRAKVKENSEKIVAEEKAKKVK